MKFIIKGVEYPGESIYRPTLGDLRELKRATRTETFAGVTQRTMLDSFVKWGGAFNDGPKMMELLEEDEFTLNMQGLAWVLMRNAGQAVAFTELDSLSMADIQIGVEPGDVEDPKAPTDPGDEHEPDGPTL